MTRRQEILSRKAVINMEIDQLYSELNELEKESLLLSDNVQRFEEKMETIGRGRKKREFLIGRIYWTEVFKDEDTKEEISIERNRAVRQNGEWI